MRVSFNIPVNASGLFHIVLYDGGVPKAIGGSFNPEYAAGVTFLNVDGTDVVDLVAMLVNEDTGAEAKIGVYRVDFDSKSVQELSGDIDGAFEAVGGIKGATPAPQQTEAPATTPPPVVTEAPAPIVTEAPAPVVTEAPNPFAIP